jgi:hypothetical protein
MSPRPTSAPELFTIREVALAACVPVSELRAVIEAGEAVMVRDRFIAFEDAVRLARRLRQSAGAAAPARGLFAPPRLSERARSVPLAASGALHAGMLAALILIAGLSARSQPRSRSRSRSAWYFCRRRGLAAAEAAAAYASPGLRLWRRFGEPASSEAPSR